MSGIERRPEDRDDEDQRERKQRRGVLQAVCHMLAEDNSFTFPVEAARLMGESVEERAGEQSDADRRQK